MPRKIHRFGKLTRERRKKEAQSRKKNPLERNNTGIRSAVRYGFTDPKEALKTPNLPNKLITWLKNRPDLTNKTPK